MRTIDKFWLALSVLIMALVTGCAVSAVATRSWADMVYVIGIVAVVCGDHIATVVFYSRWQRDRLMSDGVRDAGDRVKVVSDEGPLEYGTIKYRAMKDNKLRESRGRCGTGWIVKLDSGKTLYVSGDKIRSMSPLEQLADCAE